ncbi:hypothetical protein ACHAWX_006450 [Stephanocyclus meneghinianus]
MSSIDMFQTPVTASANCRAHCVPTCPPAPRKLSSDPIPFHIMDDFHIPGFPVLPSKSQTNSSSASDITVIVKRLRPRPTFFPLTGPKFVSPIEADATTEDGNDDSLTELPESFINAFGDDTSLRNQDSDGRQYKRVRRSSLLDGIRNRRPSFAGAA